MKKIILIFLVAFGFCGCGVFGHGTKGYVYPINEDGVNVVNVKLKSKGEFSYVYKISEFYQPLWCSTGEEYKRYINELSVMLLPQRPHSTPMYVACYSGNRPVVGDTHPSNNTIKIGDGLTFSYHPTEEFYVAGAVVTTSCVQSMPVYYFSLYSEFCLGTDVKCCMNGDGKRFTLYTLFKGPFDNSAKQNVKSFFDYIKRSTLPKSAQDSSYNIFTSYIQDECSFNRWNHGAVYMGVSEPQNLLDKKYWDQKFGSLGSCSVEIKKTAVLVAGQTPSKI